MSNIIVLAAAGAGKTELLVRAALRSGGRVLITTFTNRNADEIRSRIIKRRGFVPGNLYVETWFTFLLREAVKPYQSAITSPFRAKSINFDAERPRYAPRSDVGVYFFDGSSNVYRDGVADLACLLNTRTGGAVLRRLAGIFDLVFVDEVQDLAGYDLTFLELLMASRIDLIAVGDPRQHTFSTNRSRKGKQFQGSGFQRWAENHQRRGTLILRYISRSRRCNQAICHFADRLFPSFPPTRSRNKVATGHDGVFLVSKRDVEPYVARYRPMGLRWNRSTVIADCLSRSIANIGEVKGGTYDRVILYCTKKMLAYLGSASIADAGSLEHFYVALTRARHSVGLVVGSREFRSPMAEVWLPDAEMALERDGGNPRPVGGEDAAGPPHRG